MNRLAITAVLFVTVSLMLLDTAQAVGRRRVRSRATSVSISIGAAPAAYYQCNDQGKCEMEAAYMAANGIRRHIWGNIGAFEGIGWGGPGCATCTPRRGMTLTGDAQIGNVRVRSWR